MKITIDNTDILEGIQFRVITSAGIGNPMSAKAFFLIELVTFLFRAFVLCILAVPAIFYVNVVMDYWLVLKAEGLTLWQAGAGLGAAYGLGLHWWRTSIQDKLYKIEMKKAYRQTHSDL